MIINYQTPPTADFWASHR